MYRYVFVVYLAAFVHVIVACAAKLPMVVVRERERSTRGDRVLFSSVGLWEGFLGVKIKWSLWF